MTLNKPQRIPLDTTEGQPPVPPPELVPPVAASLAGPPLDPVQLEAIQEGVLAALKTCFDPEVPVNIYELGLIYDVDVKETGAVDIKMTLTSPGCPVATTLPPEVQAKVKAVPGVTASKVDVVWDPPWTPDRMTEAARLQLGLFD
jgi:FeS assembly SUF system protein